MTNINVKFIAVCKLQHTNNLLKLVCLIGVTKATQTKTVIKMSIKKFYLGNKYNMRKRKKRKVIKQIQVENKFGIFLLLYDKKEKKI